MCFFFQAEDGIRDVAVTGVQTCALPIFYAAAAFNEHNPWWLVMPDVTRYLQRMSLLLRQGNPANDVALLLPTDDAWAQFTATLSGLPGESRTDLPRSEEHTSELQSRLHLVCRLLLGKKKTLPPSPVPAP